MTHRDHKSEPLSVAELDELWWGIARAIRMCDNALPCDVLPRYTLSAAWQAVEYLRNREQDREKKEAA